MLKSKNLISNWPTYSYYDKNSHYQERALQPNKVPEPVHKTLPKEQDRRGMHYNWGRWEACDR